MSLISDEYLKIIDLISQYDSHLLIIKGWSITIGMAFIGYSFQQKNKSILLLCIVSSICFAFIDAKFKEYQVSYYPRLDMIEKCMVKASAQPISEKEEELTYCSSFNIHGSWDANKKWYGVFLQLFKLNVWLPHLILVIFSLFLYRKSSYFK